MEEQPSPTSLAMASLGLLDDLSKSVMHYLQSHPSVVDIQGVNKAPASEEDIREWDRRHGPLQLPSDLKTFLLTANGLELRWSCQLPTSCFMSDPRQPSNAVSESATAGAFRKFPLGCMSVNGINDIDPVRLVSRDVASADQIETPQSVSQLLLARPLPPFLPLPAAGASHIGHLSPGMASPDRVLPTVDLRAFDLDRNCRHGHVCLVYCRGPADPQVWFQDRGTSWHFVANSFADYFRLVLLHLGLPNWQYLFTTCGLDPVSAQWMKFFLPARATTGKVSMTMVQSLLTPGRPQDAGYFPGGLFFSSSSSSSAAVAAAAGDASGAGGASGTARGGKHRKPGAKKAAKKSNAAGSRKNPAASAGGAGGASRKKKVGRSASAISSLGGGGGGGSSSTSPTPSPRTGSSSHGISRPGASSLSEDALATTITATAITAAAAMRPSRPSSARSVRS